MFTSAMTLAVAAALLQAPPPTAPGRPPASQAQAPALDPEDLPTSVERIQKGLAQPDPIRLEIDRPVFRTEVFGRKPTIEDILGPDFAYGRPNYGGITHQEFLDMVTPEDVRGYAAFSNREAFSVAATSFLLKWGLQKAVAKFKEARTARQREDARREVEDALRDLDRARARAGLPPR